MSVLTSLEVLEDRMDRNRIEASDVLGTWQLPDVAEGCPTSDAVRLCFRMEHIKIAGGLTKRQIPARRLDLIVFRMYDVPALRPPTSADSHCSASPPSLVLFKAAIGRLETPVAREVVALTSFSPFRTVVRVPY